MTQYEVHLKATESRLYYVEAESEKEAESKAQALYENDEPDQDGGDGSPAEFDCYATEA
jgi:hypothetical protein